MGLVEWINSNLPIAENPLIVAICLGILWLVIYDFYHLLFNAVISWFKKSK